MLPAGYGYPYKTTDSWLLNYMIHNLTPKPTRCGSPTTSTSSRDVAGGGKASRPSRPIWMDVQNGEHLPGVRRAQGQRHDGKFTYPDDATDPYERPARRTSGRSTDDGVLSRPRRPPAPRRPARRPLAAAPARRHRSRPKLGPATPRTSSVGGEVLRAGGRGVVGRVDDGDARRLAGRGARRATCCRSRPPTTRRARRGTSRWGSWSCGWPTAPTATTRSPSTVDAARRAHPRAPARERQPRRQPDADTTSTRRSCRRRPARATASTIGNFVYAARRHAASTSTVPDGQGGPVDHVRQPRRADRQRHLAHDHRVQGAVQPRRPASRTRSPTATCSSTPASSATAGPPTAGRVDVEHADRPARRAPTPTSAGSTRSCGARSGSPREARRAFASPSPLWSR